MKCEYIKNEAVSLKVYFCGRGWMKRSIVHFAVGPAQGIQIPEIRIIQPSAAILRLEVEGIKKKKEVYYSNNIC